MDATIVEAYLCLIQVLQALHHPNVVSCKEAFVTAGKLCILMDYCSEGTRVVCNNTHCSSRHGMNNNRSITHTQVI